MTHTERQSEGAGREKGPLTLLLRIYTISCCDSKEQTVLKLQFCNFSDMKQPVTN